MGERRPTFLGRSQCTLSSVSATSLGSRDCFEDHRAEEETEAQRRDGFPGHLPKRAWGWGVGIAAHVRRWRQEAGALAGVRPLGSPELQSRASATAPGQAGAEGRPRLEGWGWRWAPVVLLGLGY